ncbi:uncharacterized protein K441DRAFT_238483 [Cenococcum geophilum 1.58]|uniref:uncharacterized protein n=1 Tax=Cenococcum geophilum 1.58 TaxID=794803 RepID=UPI00358F9732|nr:hypothetical protein K441DRAFT_238483 [Cenococcum geophilum 1.58]
MWSRTGLLFTRELRAPRNAAALKYFSQAAGEQKAPPVSLEEFWEALGSIWPSTKNVKSQRFGLAVSGGVDSMALASLCANTSHILGDFPKCVALIVDHKSRPESTEEALWVAQQLLKHAGMNSHILPLQWSKGTNPSELLNFETQARTLRYQALGIACRDHGLRSLLVAHHSDDQAETIITRLIQGHVRSGLRGIQAIKEIPECFGLHGVHQSGGLENMRDSISERKSNLLMEIETGGVQILRPLLQFSKEKLISTCLENQMPWVEDNTNQDKTLTVRNAIRYIIQHHRLPAALRKDELVNLSLRMQYRLGQNMEVAEELFDSCELKLDVRYGTLNVRFSEKTFRVLESDSSIARTVAALLLGRLAEIVSPNETVSPRRLDTVIDTLFPALRTSNTLERPSPNGFTAAGVQFRPIVDQGRRSSLHPKPFTPQYNWLLSRQPYSLNEPASTTINSNKLGSDNALDAARTSDGFQLFDGRFWIRIINPSKRTVIIRSLREADIRPMRKALMSPTTRANLNRFNSLITAIKPANIRWTLPALVMVGDTGKEHVIALPSLGYRIGSRAQECEVRWDIRYKKIKGGTHDLDKVIVHSPSKSKASVNSSGVSVIGKPRSMELGT